MIAAPADVEEALRLKHGPAAAHGQWTLPMHRRFGYVSPDAWYEGTLLRLCRPGAAWLDVGGGRHVFPHNGRAAELLARRCRLLVGLDPSPNILANAHVHERLQR
ncbi:MAG: hypothetical protein M3Y41_16965, partial [Pseudomonadota bacterium]|nr:hypothetical protein [Pseudomonadota bacterium]